MTSDRDDELDGTRDGSAPENAELTEGQAESAEDASSEGDQVIDAESTGARRRRLTRASVSAVVLAVLLAASAGVAVWLYFTQYRPDQGVDDAARQTVLKAAADGTIALLSYSPETLDADFANAKSHLTGDFLSYYTQFTQQIVTPAAQQKAVKTSAAVARKAIAEMHPDSAVVLVFLNQVTTSKENPDGSFTASAVKVSLQRHDDTWLISSFDPV
jgi:Mce-associated membrane protein